ncbi:MAG: DUF2975 domain-containing protein [Rhodospirillales bacterium]|nr:DUF2975 domain-containing protein [Rhodospirillales bacterium]
MFYRFRIVFLQALQREAVMNNLSRVQRISRILKWVCTLSIPAIPILLAVMWATWDWWQSVGAAATGIRLWGGEIKTPDPLPGYSLILGYLASMLPGGLAVFAMWQLRSLFALYCRGQIFSIENSRHLRRFALAVLGMTLVGPLSETLTILAVTFGNPPGQRLLSISISSSQLVTLLVGAVFLVIAWVMEEGRELAEDQATIV